MFQIFYYFGDDVRIIENSRRPWEALEAKLKAHKGKITKVVIKVLEDG